MGSIEVIAKIKVGDENREATASYDFGDDLASAVKKTSEAVVFTNYVQSAKITLQAGMRRALKDGKDPLAFVSGFVPGIATARAAVDPVIAMKAKFTGMTKAERAEFLGELKGIQ